VSFRTLLVADSARRGEKKKDCGSSRARAAKVEAARGKSKHRLRAWRDFSSSKTQKERKERKKDSRFGRSFLALPNDEGENKGLFISTGGARKKKKEPEGTRSGTAVSSIQPAEGKGGGKRKERGRNPSDHFETGSDRSRSKKKKKKKRPGRYSKGKYGATAWVVGAIGPYFLHRFERKREGGEPFHILSHLTTLAKKSARVRLNYHIREGDKERGGKFALLNSFRLSPGEKGRRMEAVSSAEMSFSAHLQKKEKKKEEKREEVWASSTSAIHERKEGRKEMISATAVTVVYCGRKKEGKR